MAGGVAGWGVAGWGVAGGGRGGRGAWFNRSISLAIMRCVRRYLICNDLSITSSENTARDEHGSRGSKRISRTTNSWKCISRINNWARQKNEYIFKLGILMLYELGVRRSCIPWICDARLDRTSANRPSSRSSRIGSTCSHGAWPPVW